MYTPAPWPRRLRACLQSLLEVSVSLLCSSPWGNLGLSFATALWIFSRTFSCPHHPTQPTEDSSLAFWSGADEQGP